MGRSTTICAVFLAAGCGADAGQGSPWFIDEAADVRTIEQAVEAELRANPGWEHENISDHGTERTELLFAENELRAHVDDYDLFRDENPQVYRDAVGSWSVDERGVVHLEWQADGYGFVEERTWAPTSAEFAAQLRERDPHERGVWVSTGYLAQDASLTRFYHRWWKSSGYTEQGGAESTLVLSASPQELAGGAPCAFRFEMRVVAREQTGEENFEFECDVQQVDGFHRVRSIEMPEDAYPIQWWEEMLKEQGLADSYEYAVYAPLRDVALPELWFDPRRPEVVVTDGYGESMNGFDESDHDSR